MTPDALPARFAQEVAHAERTLLADGTVHPLFTIVDAGGRTRPVVADFTTEDAKRVSLAIVRHMCVADAAVAVFHRAEAWLVLGDLLPGLSPSQSDRRMEVLQVFGVDRVDGALLQKVSLREIERDLTGAVSGLRPLPLPELDDPWSSDMGLGGRMAELLSEEPPSFVERRRARDVLDRVAKRLARGQTAFAGRV